MSKWIGPSCLLLLAFSADRVPSSPLGERQVMTRVDSLLGRMTLEEKIGQLTQVGGLAFTPDAPKPEDLIRKGQAGSVLWLSDPAAINKLQRIAVEETRLGIPLIFGLDVIHGFRTLFPMPLAMAASWDPVMIERVQSIAAREARAAGVTWTFAPMLDIARDPRDAAFRALTAGVNMDMASGTYLQHLGVLVKEGLIPVSLIDSSVRPILAAKFRLGLFEHPYVDEARARQVIGAPEHRQAARIAAQRSAVLLRNEGRLLPLPKDDGKSIAVIGPLADAKRDLLTMWSGFDVDPAGTVTVLEGIRGKLGADARVDYAQGVEIRKQISSMFDTMVGGKQPAPWTADRADSEFSKAVDLARRSDLVVLVLGELARMSGELASQSSLDLPGRQQQLLEAVADLGKPSVLVLVNGRPPNITWAAGRIPAILEAWHPGTEGGNAIADLLFGDANPAGKLPVTWPRDAGQIPIYYAHNLTHQPETAPDFTSRYWDQASTPLYRFGHGLSYTRFEFSNLRLKQSTVRLASAVEVTVDVTNTGDRPGDEVVQIYIHQQSGRASRPVRELKGFERISLAAGEKKTVRFSLGKNELSYWSSREKMWVQDAATFDLWAGADSGASLHTTFQIVR